MTYGETWRLVGLLLNDPSSQLSASLGDWKHPLTREDQTLRDLYDLMHQLKSPKKIKAYPRPWPERTSKRATPDADVTQDQVIAALRWAGHTALAPGESRIIDPRPRDGRGRFVKRD